MGIRFSLTHTNLVAYITTPAAEPPRSAWMDLDGFVAIFVNASPDVFISANPSRWLRTLSDAGQKSELRFRKAKARMQLPLPLAPGIVVEDVLGPIKRAIGTYRFYALALPTESDWWGSRSQLGDAAGFLARASGKHALVLIPSDPVDSEPKAVDALPPLTAILGRDKKQPGMLFWTSRGASAFVSMQNLEQVIRELLNTAESGPDSGLDTLIESLPPEKPRRILHLSDLHFGTSYAMRNQALLEAELSEVVRQVDHIVITGDLFDTPDPGLAGAFQAFRQSLARLSGLDPLVIPGNHDQRLKGTFGADFRQITSLPHRDVVAFHGTRTVFLSFNSSISGSWARGRVTADQMARVGAELRSEFVKDPRTKDYLKVALIHHHPISFEVEPTSRLQRALRRLGITDEPLLRLEDSKEFLDWCARWDVSVILHGHKHVPRFTEIEVTPEFGQTRRITGIGCGSSLGAEGSPCSYDIVYWNEPANSWTARFLASRGGGPFEVHGVTVARTGSTGEILRAAS